MDTAGDGSARADTSSGRSELLRMTPPTTFWRASQRTGCVIVAVHAFGDHRGAFAEIAEALNAHGHDLIAYDQRGFGETAHRGAYAGHDPYRQDLREMVARARAEARRRPVVVMAESFGASVALSAVGRGLVGCDALILSGPGVRENLPARPFWDTLIQAAAHIFGSGSVRLNQVSEAMSQRAQARFRDDPLIVRDVRADTYNHVVEMADMASLDATRVRVPTLVLYSEQDNVIARESIDALMLRLGDRGQLRTYAHAPHLVLQARDRSEIERDILQFLSTLRAA